MRKSKAIVATAQAIEGPRPEYDGFRLEGTPGALREAVYKAYAALGMTACKHCGRTSFGAATDHPVTWLLNQLSERLQAAAKRGPGAA